MSVRLFLFCFKKKTPVLEIVASSGPNDQGQEESIISQMVRKLASTKNTIYRVYKKSRQVFSISGSSSMYEVFH